MNVFFKFLLNFINSIEKFSHEISPIGKKATLCVKVAVSLIRVKLSFAINQSNNFSEILKTLYLLLLSKRGIYKFRKQKIDNLVKFQKQTEI